DLDQLGPVAHHPSGQVRDRDVPVPGEALGEVEGLLEALARRCRHGEGALHGHVLEELVLDRGRREHLVPHVLEQPDRRARDLGFVAHHATYSVIRTVERESRHTTRSASTVWPSQFHPRCPPLAVMTAREREPRESSAWPRRAGSLRPPDDRSGGRWSSWWSASWCSARRWWPSAGSSPTR